MIPILIGTETGTAEYVADELQQYLADNDINSECYIEPRAADLDQSKIAIIVTSTQGAGDIPNNLVPFNAELSELSLTDYQFLIICLGDSNYDRYCGAGKRLKANIEQQQGSIIGYLEIDANQDDLPEDIALSWLSNKLALLNQ